MVDPWYSLEGHPMPFEGNHSRKAFAQLRLRNITFGHLEQACARISTPRVEASKRNTSKGLIIILSTDEPSLSEAQIEMFFKEIRVHLRKIVRYADTNSERDKRMRDARERASVDRERVAPAYVNVPRYR